MAGFTHWVLVAVLATVLGFPTALIPAVQLGHTESSLSRITTDHYEFLFSAEDYEPAEVHDFAERRERRIREMADRLRVELPREPIQFYLYADYERKGAREHGRAEFSLDLQEASVAAVWNEVIPQVEALPDARVLVERAWGRAGHPFLALAAAAYAANIWRGQTLSAWGAQITFEEGPYSLDFLANADTGRGRQAEFLSPLVHRPLAGEFARWVVSRWGLSELRKLYSEARSPLVPDMAGLLETSPAELENGWRQWLLQRASRYSPGPTPAHPPVFQRGVAFTQERWRNGGDYASSRIVEALAPLKELGVDSITVHPFAFMPGPDVPVIIRYSGESDEGINNTTYRAQRLGLRVMLKPQIWLRHGAFAGDVRFDNESDRTLWFSRYRRWILHYARLAEQNGSDLFCIGNELRHMVRYEKEWRELIAAIRRIYHGPITYAAHWGEEFETLEFWDALDYVGLNNYHPLARGGDTSADVLQEAAGDLAERVEKVHRRWRRPVILTEVGFPSVRGGTKRPWEDRTSSPVDLAEQARAYEAIFQAFYHQPWFYGMYWWKWYSTGFGGGPNDGKLTPMNKPAAEVMARWYQQVTARLLKPDEGN